MWAVTANIHAYSIVKWKQDEIFKLSMFLLVTHSCHDGHPLICSWDRLEILISCFHNVEATSQYQAMHFCHSSCLYFSHSEVLNYSQKCRYLTPPPDPLQKEQLYHVWWWGKLEIDDLEGAFQPKTFCDSVLTVLDSELLWGSKGDLEDKKGILLTSALC